MKYTKKMRKRLNGMNYATRQHFKSGHSAPKFHDFGTVGGLPLWRKVELGVPYVNPLNF